ncbi:MAG: SMP-30/gluconolactonase/LRE family protein, partial [Akkermansiaceae bacterium]|nr:SMP-30/gluconolactonase/LRE family protein [Akkermansiaceae bacterium]
METLAVRTLADGLTFGEGPRWHDGKLWISDMHGHRIVTCDMNGNIDEIHRVENRPSGLGWLPDGRLLFVSMLDMKLCVLADGSASDYCDLSPFVGGDPNDMVVDAQGRAYVGNFGFDLIGGEEMKGADLVMVGLDRKATVVANDLLFPNGTVITPDGRTL